MANEFLAQLTPRDFFRESAMGTQDMFNLAQVGDLAGLVFPKLATHGYTALVPISHANTFTTGITLSLYTVDDGADAADLGKVVRFGITPKRLIDAETVDVDTGAATEVTVDVTLESTAGNITVNTVAIANAALDSLASGEAMLLRIRRIGSHANDTCQGRAIVLGASIKNT
jgi:hypothetical protein